MENPFRYETDDDLAGLLLAMPLLAGLSLALVVFWFGEVSWRGLRARFAFEEAECRIESGGLAAARAADPTRTRPEFRFQVRARGASYPATGYDAWDETMNLAAARAELARFFPGAVVPCWHDPDDPSRAVLNRSLNPWWLAAAPLIAGCFLFGGLGSRWAIQEYRRRSGDGSSRI